MTEDLACRGQGTAQLLSRATSKPTRTLVLPVTRTHYGKQTLKPPVRTPFLGLSCISCSPCCWRLFGSGQWVSLGGDPRPCCALWSKTFVAWPPVAGQQSLDTTPLLTTVLGSPEAALVTVALTASPYCSHLTVTTGCFRP